MPQPRNHIPDGPQYIERTEKRCSHCKETKDAAAFHPSMETKDGLANYCKACDAERMRIYRQTHPEYRERERLRVQRYRRTHPACRFRELERKERARTTTHCARMEGLA